MNIPTQLKILFLTTLANWISKEKSHMIEYLLAANRILKSKLESDGRRIKYTDSERAILAKKGRKLSWNLLKKCEFLTPETILRWYNRLIAKKYTAKSKSKLGKTDKRICAQNRMRDGFIKYKLGSRQNRRSFKAYRYSQK